MTEPIETNLSKPKRASTKDVTVEQHSLPDQIAADRYLANKAAAKARGMGVRYFKLVPPGAS